MRSEPYHFSDWDAGKLPPLGWDCADAVDDGWTKQQLDHLMRSTVRDWVPPAKRTDRQDHSPKDVATTQKITSHGPRKLPPKLFANSPLRSARALIEDRHKRKGLRTIQHHRGGFYEWTGAHYQQPDRDAVDAMVWSYLDTATTETPKGDIAPFNPNRSKVGDVVAGLAAACNLSSYLDAPCWLIDDPNQLPASELLAVKNGLLHLPSGRLLPATPAFFGLNLAGVEYSTDTTPPAEWLAFLGQIWPGDGQSIETLQELFGYFLAPDTSQQKIALIVGPKRSGKGTIARILTELLGHDSVAAPTLASLATNFGLAPLIGKSVGIIGDARLSSRADQSAIAERLLSISGEDSLTIDRKFLSAWTGRLPIRFVIMTNELPRLADASGALASRFVVLTMEKSFFGHEDRGLFARLLPELPGILTWAREGYLRLNARGYFNQPASARDAIEELEALGSPVAAFVKECCIIEQGKVCSVEDVFSAWRAWCEENGRKEPGTAQSFGRDLRAVVSGLRITQPRMEGKQVRCYEGIGIRSWKDDGSKPDEDIPW